MKTSPLVEFYEANYKKPKVRRRKLNKLKIQSIKNAESDYTWANFFNVVTGQEKSKPIKIPTTSVDESNSRLISVSESINISDDFSLGNNSSSAQSQSASHNSNSSLMEEAEISYASNFSDFGSTNTLMEVGASSVQSVQYIEGASTRGSHVGVREPQPGGRTISRSVPLRLDSGIPLLPRAALDAIGMVMVR